MSSRKQLQQLCDRVRQQRQALETVDARWVVPATAFATGVLFPVLTGKRSANPISQTTSFVKKFSVRALRFMVFRNLWEILRKHQPEVHRAFYPGHH